MREFNGRVVQTWCLYDSEDYKIYKCKVTKGSNGYEYGSDIVIAGGIPTLEKGIEYSIKTTPKKTKYGVTHNIKNGGIKMHVTDGTDKSKLYEQFLSTITSPDIAENILKAYPNFVRLVIDGKDKEIDLNRISGVKDKRFATIKRAIFNNIVSMDIIEEYGEYELSFKMAQAILNECNGSMELVRQRMKSNPYGLLTGIKGIGFKTADELIKKIRPDLLDSKYRLLSCADYIIEENESTGSTWMYFKELYTTLGELVPETLSHVVSVIDNKKDFYFDRENNRIARMISYRLERYISDRIKEILNGDDDKYNWSDSYNGEEPDYEAFRNLDGKFDLSDEQMKTMSMVFKNNFSVLTGSAGMGKSSGAKGLLNMMDKAPKGSLSYTLTAPTGAASEVLSDYTHREASTIHKAIFKKPDEEEEMTEDGEPKEDPPMIDSNLLVIDEASMINIQLMAQVLKEVNVGTKVLLICDPEQLPAIGAGKVIFDLIESGIVPVNKLTKVYRFDDGGLDMVTTDIRNGKRFLPENMNTKSVNFGVDGDYSFVLSEKDKMLKEVVALYLGLLKGGNDLSDIGIMSALNVRDLGTKQINAEIQSILSKGKPFIKHGDTEYRLGDKVVQTRNNYKAVQSEFGFPTHIFNGNQGIITEIDVQSKTLVVTFKANKQVFYDIDTIKDLSLAYATSVHKFQGSGCKIAIVVTPSSHTFMLNKNLLYTALTRSTQRTIHFSDKVSTINIALKKSENYTRNTFLKEMLMEA